MTISLKSDPGAKVCPKCGHRTVHMKKGWLCLNCGEKGQGEPPSAPRMQQPPAKCDTLAGWCSCGQYHKKEREPSHAPAKEKPGLPPGILPCGCRVRNAQGATITGKFAPTRLIEDGVRACRCGRKWKVHSKWIEVQGEK